MKFKVKDVDISTGRALVAILNHKDAEKLDLHSADRIIVKKGKKRITCILNISENNESVLKDSIGLYEEVLKKLNVKNGSIVEIEFTGKPESITHIRDKLNGKPLNPTEMLHIARDITEDRLTQVEKTYFVSASYIHGLNMNEIIGLTKAMVATGDKLKFPGITLDKHCIGGVAGNRTTMIVIPIIAAAGFTIPKTSSRAITSPAGTADTMECLAKVELSYQKIKSIVKKTKACMVHGGSMNLAPADDKIIEVEHPLSIDAEGQLVASVMAKKFSVSSNHVLIDIPCGKGAKVDCNKNAKPLKRTFEKVGKKLGMNVKVILTDGSQPVGNGIGPLLEARDVMSVLRNDVLAPQDLKHKSLDMAGILLSMTGKYKNGRKKAKEILESGKALVKMNEIINAQGRQKMPKLGSFKYEVKSKFSGIVESIDNKTISKIARVAGAPKDKGSGLLLSKHVNHSVAKRDILYTIFAENQFKLNLAIEVVKKNVGYIIRK